MRLSRYAGVAAGLLSAAALVASPAAAAGPYAVTTSAVQLAFPNSGPRGVRDYHVGDTILDVPLFWWSAATLGEAVTVEADGASEQLPKGAILPLHMLGEGKVDQIKAYCTPRRAGERAAERGALGALLGGGSLWRSMMRKASDRQLCLIDSDADGRVDQSLVVGDGSPEARTPRPIPPVAIDVADKVPISDQDRLRIKLTGVGRKGNWAEFKLDIVQQGHARVFDRISQSWGDSLRITRVEAGATPPTSASILGAAFTVLAMDGGNKTARVEWGDGADEDLFAVIPDALRIVVR